LVWLNLRNNLESYVQRRTRSYLFLFALFATGVFLGVLALRYLPGGDWGELTGQLDTSLSSLRAAGGHLNQQAVLGVALVTQLRKVFLFWLLGATIVGAPLVAGLVLAEGFSNGFTVGLLVAHYGLKGAFLAGLTLVPKDILLVPALLWAAESSLAFSFLLLRAGLGWRRVNLGQEFLGYSLQLALAAFLFVLAGLVEAFIVPVFLRHFWLFLAEGFLPCVCLCLTPAVASLGGGA